jgi:hypothetical protein
MRKRILKVDILEIKTAYPKSDWPCLDYCCRLLEEGQNPNTRLECWNYSRVVPEADWVVKNIGIYAKDGEYWKKKGLHLK